MQADTGLKILARLDGQEKSEGSLSPLLAFYRSLVAIQHETGRRAGTPRPESSGMAFKERLKEGLPLLVFDELELDWALVQETFEKVRALFIENTELFGQVPGYTGGAVDYTLSREDARSWFEGSGRFDSREDGSPRDYFLGSMIHAALSPFLTGYAEVLLGYVEQEKWRRRQCPVCGSRPDFAFLDRENGARWLLCSRCDARWLFQRLECPYCGTTDQNALAYYTDEAGLYRLYICDKCHCYLKAIDLRRTESEALLPLERLLTLDIDAQAQQNGYSPCWGGEVNKRGTG